MKKSETFYKSIILPTILTFKMLIPTFYSFRRLEKSCKKWIKKDPQAYFPRSFLADLYRFYQKNEEAKKEYLEIKDLGCMTDKDWLGLGEVLFRLEDYQGLIETLAPIIDRYPRDKNANWYLGISYMKKEEFQNAVFYLERVIATGSKRYENYWHLGFCYYHVGKLEQANDAYYKALAMKPDSKELRQNIASTHIRIGQSLLDKNLDSAEKEFKKALNINPGDSEAIRILKSIDKIRIHDQTIEELKKQLKIEQAKDRRDRD